MPRPVSIIGRSQRVTSIEQGKSVTDPVSKAVVFPCDRYIFRVGRAFTGEVGIVL